MGYFTNFELTIQKNSSQSTDEEIIADLRSTNEEAECALQEDGGPLEPRTWYDHEEDLVEFSKKYPDVIFMLQGEGEEASDMWKLYVKNGKSKECRARIEFEDFDPNEL